MARAVKQHKTKPTKQTPRQPSPWLLVKDTYRQLRKSGLEPHEAVQLLTSMPWKKRYVNSNGEKILPVVDGQIQGIELSIEIDTVTAADYLEIHDREYFHPSQDEPVEFYNPTANVERELKQLRSSTAAPPTPGKKPTPKKKRRKARSASAKTRRRGPKAKILPRVAGAMKTDIAEGKLSLDELEAISDKTLADRYSAKRERATAARQSVVDELKNNYQQLPTIPTITDKK